MGTKTSIAQESVDPIALVKARNSAITALEDMIHNDFMDRRGANDKVLDIQDEEWWYQIVTVERIINEKKTTHKILVHNNKIILRDKQDIRTNILWDNDFFVASYKIYSGGKYTRGNYIKDIKNNKVLTQTLEVAHISTIKHHKESNLYLINMTDNSIIDGYTHVRLFDENGWIIDEGWIEILENDLYVKRIWRWSDSERIADVYYNKIEKEDNGKYKIKNLFQGLEVPSDWATNKDNHYQYMGDGIVIESAPRGGKNRPTPYHVYEGEFGQATDILSSEKKQSPEYTGKLLYVSQEVFGVRLQIYPKKDTIYSARTHKFRTPYINFVTFDGSLITQKPYYHIKKIWNTIFAKPVREDMISIADSMDKTKEEILPTKVDKRYISNESVRWVHERIVIDPQTFDPLEEDEIFFNIQEEDNYIQCTKTNQEIVIYGKDGNRKADAITSYITLQDQVFECTLITWEKVYYDNKWNKINF